MNDNIHPLFRDLLKSFAPKEIDFSCRVCGVKCDIAPNPPARAVCPAHCDDHNYEYVRDERRHMCKNCGQEPPLDWYDV